MNTITAKQLDEAKEQLPKVFVIIDDLFKEEYEKPLAVIREFLEDKGKLQLLEVGDKQILSRIPNQAILNDVKKRSEKLNGFESDSYLVAKCIYYPSMDVLEGWVKEGRPGLVTAFAKTLMELGYIYVAATSKEF